MRAQFSRSDMGWLVAAVLPLVGVLPTLTGAVINTADGPLHIHRIQAMAVMLGQGNLWPRWVPYLHLGYGYPIFNYYPPGVFYLGGLLVRAGMDAAAAFTVVATLAWILGSVGAYVLARRFLPASSALLAAALWAYAPSRLFEVWDQGSLPQMMAAALVPWLFYGLSLAAARPTRRSALLIAFAFAGISLSHLPILLITALFALPAALLMPLWTARRDRGALLRRWGASFGGLALGIGLAAIFLLPLALELRLVAAAEEKADNVPYLISNFLQFNEIFAQPQPMDLTDMRAELPTTLGLIGGLLSAAGIVALAVKRRYVLALTLAVALGFTLFMLVEPSLPVWLTIPMFRQLRFPERFLRLGALWVALAGGASLLLLPARWRFAGLVLVASLAAAAVLPMTYGNQRFVRMENLTAADEIRFEETTYIWGTTSYDEFDPVWGRQIPLDPPPEPQAYATDPLRLVVKETDPIRYFPALRTEQLDSTATRVTVTEARALRFRQYYFPGWTATLDGQPVAVKADADYGLLTVDVPPGEHIVRLQYAGTPAQTLGAALTLVSLAAALLLVRLKLPAAAHDRLPAEITTDERLSSRHGWAIIGGAAALALVNTFIIGPHTLWFRYQSPPDAPVLMQTALRQDFGGLFELLGYTLDKTEVSPGEALTVTLYWRAKQRPEHDYRPVVQLVNLSLTEAWAVSEPLYLDVGRPASYDPQRFDSEVHEMRVFDSAPPYVGRISVQILDNTTAEALRLPDGSDRVLFDAPIRVHGESPEVNHLLDYHLSDAVALWCASVQEQEGALHIDLYWRAAGPVQPDVTVFVHGLDKEGRQVAQNDAQPVGGNYPSSYWLPGQTITDHHTLPADARIDSIGIGLYTPDNQRLAVTRDGQPVPDNSIQLPLAAQQCVP